MVFSHIKITLISREFNLIKGGMKLDPNND